jgi:hypothetical protein
MHCLPLNAEKKQKEWGMIQTIAKNKNFPQSLLRKLNRQMNTKLTIGEPEEKTKKLWTTFTDHSPKILKITNLFKNTKLGITFRTTTTLRQLTTPTPTDQTLEYEKSGFYKFSCKKKSLLPTCTQLGHRHSRTVI